MAEAARNRRQAAELRSGNWHPVRTSGLTHTCHAPAMPWGWRGRRVGSPWLMPFQRTPRNQFLPPSKGMLSVLWRSRRPELPISGCLGPPLFWVPHASWSVRCATGPGRHDNSPVRRSGTGCWVCGLLREPVLLTNTLIAPDGVTAPGVTSP